MAGLKEDVEAEGLGEEDEEWEDEDYEDEEEGEIGAAEGGAKGTGGGGGEIEQEGGDVQSKFRGVTPQQLQALLQQQAARQQQAQVQAKAQQMAASAEAGARLAPLEAEPEEWKGLKQMPLATQNAVQAQLGRLREAGRKECTVLLLGRGGVGKSTLCNQLLGERKLRVNPYGLAAPERTVMLSRVAPTPAGAGEGGAGNVQLNIIDTPGLVLNDRTHEGALLNLADQIRGRPIDVVLYVDRLDLYLVETLDREVMESVSRVLGREIWSKTLIVLTHGDTKPPGTADYETFSAQRGEQVRAALRNTAGKGVGAGALAHRIVENSSLCNRNWSGEKVLPDAERTPWVPALVEGLVEAALAGDGKPYVLQPNANSPNRKWRWLIPLAVAAQAALVKWVFLPALRHDDKWGDQFGPWDKKLNWVKRQEYNLFVEGKEVPKKEAASPVAPAEATSAAPASTAPKKKTAEALEQDAPLVPAPPKKKPSTSSSSGKKSSSGGKSKKKKSKKKSSKSSKSGSRA